MAQTSIIINTIMTDIFCKKNTFSFLVNKHCEICCIISKYGLYNILINLVVYLLQVLVILFKNDLNRVNIKYN